jgi:hypothetical protein
MPVLRQRYQDGPVIGQLEIWRPLELTGTFEARTRVGSHTRYYPGAGCIVPPRYGDKTLHWYQLVLRRVREALGAA